LRRSAVIEVTVIVVIEKPTKIEFKLKNTRSKGLEREGLWGARKRGQLKSAHIPAAAAKCVTQSKPSLPV